MLKTKSVVILEAPESYRYTGLEKKGEESAKKQEEHNTAVVQGRKRKFDRRKERKLGACE